MENIGIKRVKPDVLVKFNEENVTENLPIIVVYVRPKTNLINYEKEILSGLKPYADVIYLANLNGAFIIENSLIYKHYSTEILFAIEPRKEIEKYPEIIENFERYFNEDFNKAEIIGSFEAVDVLNMSPSELFGIIVDNKDFLKICGQTIKKINNKYIVNYNIPHVLNEYTPETNIFVLAAQLKSNEISFKEVDQAIFEKIKNDSRTPIIDEDKFKKVSNWEDKIRRTYHLSHNNLTAAFDMLDFVYSTEGKAINFENTSFGKYILNRGKFTIEQLIDIKCYSIRYIDDNGKKKLVNIHDEANDKSFLECEQLLEKIIW